MVRFGKKASATVDELDQRIGPRLTWLHWKAVSLVKEQGATGLIAVTGAQVYVLHSPSFWALAIIAFGVVFFSFRKA
jgi:hypothetical protein